MPCANREAPFLDDSYAEIIINFGKAAEAILGTSRRKEVETNAKRLGLIASVAHELKRLYALRHSDDVAHAEQVEPLSTLRRSTRETSSR